MPFEMPHGIDELRERFGDPNKYVADDGRLHETWEANQIIRVPLPYPVPYAYGPQQITKVAVHRLSADLWTEFFVALAANGVPREHLLFGGAYVPRAKRTAGEWSVHAWGLAMDFRPATCPMGKPLRCDLMPEFFETAYNLGLVCGRDWKKPDPMHVQAVCGY